MDLNREIPSYVAYSLILSVAFTVFLTVKVISLENELSAQRQFGVGLRVSAPPQPAFTEQEQKSSTSNISVSNVSAISPTPATSSGQAVLTASYINSHYLFGFRYPADHTPYVGVDQENNVLTRADINSDSVSITEKESSLFCCEPITLNFRVVKEDVALDSWVNSNSQRYISDSDVISKRNVTFAGRAAVEITGPGNLGALEKLIVVKPGNFFIVITQNAASKLLDDILATFTFDVKKLK